MRMEDYPAQSLVSEPAEFPEKCEIIVHTLKNNDAYDEHFTLADLTRPNSSVLPDIQKDSNLRWLHIPANNMVWVEIFMQAWFGSPESLEDKIWKLKVRPGLPHPENKPLHSRHMEPSCTMTETSDRTVSRQPGNTEAREPDDTQNLLQPQDKNSEHSNESKKPSLALYVTIQVSKHSR